MMIVVVVVMMVAMVKILKLMEVAMAMIKCCGGDDDEW